MAILELIIGAVVGFVVEVFVYRNNVDTISPIADKIDAKVDKLELKIEELKQKIEGKDNTPML